MSQENQVVNVTASYCANATAGGGKDLLIKAGTTGYCMSCFFGSLAVFVKRSGGCECGGIGCKGKVLPAGRGKMG